MVDRRIGKLAEKDILRIVLTYHNWRNGTGYKDELGYCKEAALDKIENEDYVLSLGHFVGIVEENDYEETYEEKMQKLTTNYLDCFPGLIN